MEVRPLGLEGPLLILPRQFHDGRGVFSETYRAERYRDAGISEVFVQDNLSVSDRAGTLRGLHFQAPPSEQAKLVHCVAGAMFDVAVDLRRNSPGYGHWTGVTLTASGGEQVYLPPGFAHGFLTLEPGTIAAYKVSASYDPQAEDGLMWNDPDLAIEWPDLETRPHLSERDESWSSFAAFDSPFP